MYGKATAHSGSRNACSVKGVVKVRVTVNAECSSAVLASPRVTCLDWQRLPLLWTRGASGALASSIFLTGSRGSYSTLTSFLAASTISRVSPTTRHKASPTQRVMLPSAMNTSQSCWICPTLLTGTSSALKTARTPGSLSASDASILSTLALGQTERTAEAWTIPSRYISSG